MIGELASFALIAIGFVVMPDGPWYRQVGASVLFGVAWRITGWLP